MQAKEYMLRVFKAEDELKLINARLRHYEDLAKSLGAPFGSALPSKPTGASRVEIAAVGMADLITEMDVKSRQYIEVVKQAEAMISRLPKEKHRQVLTLRYLAGLSWKSISDEMQYKDPKSVHRVHGWALLELQKLL